MCKAPCFNVDCPCRAEGDSADMMNGHAGWDCDESGCPGCEPQSPKADGAS